MRKAASILLLCVLAFNWVGYRLLTYCLESHSNKIIEQQIDQDQYADADLIEFTIPLNTPYLSGSSAEFERYDGEAEINGILYKYVKRKIENGRLVLLCLPNTAKKQLQNARSEFFKLVNDIERPTKGKDTGNSGALKNFISECRQESNSWSMMPPASHDQEYLLANRRLRSSNFSDRLDQPPKFIA
ncbi:MAG: hypothetical protein ABI687_08630 [Flavitalea sp.]